MSASAASTMASRDKVLRGTRPVGRLPVAGAGCLVGITPPTNRLRISYASGSVSDTLERRGDAMTSHVERVQRFSTGTVDIHPQHAYRGRSPMYWWMLASRRWLPARPINVYVIEHTDGLVVFDTGQDRASVTEPDYFPDGLSGVIYSRLATFHINEDETVTAGLERLGYRTSEVTPRSSLTSTKTTSAALRRSRRPTFWSPPTNGAHCIGRCPNLAGCFPPISSSRA